MVIVVLEAVVATVAMLKSAESEDKLEEVVVVRAATEVPVEVFVAAMLKFAEDVDKLLKPEWSSWTWRTPSG